MYAETRYDGITKLVTLWCEMQQYQTQGQMMCHSLSNYTVRQWLAR
jgi:hypothetical protein